MLEILKQLEILKLKIDQFRPINDELNSVIQEKLRIDWTYNSNAIEGNTLTYGETAFFLREGGSINTLGKNITKNCKW